MSEDKKIPITIFCEGNIASGKSDFLKWIDKNDNVEVYFKDVESWREFFELNLMVKDTM